MTAISIDERRAADFRNVITDFGLTEREFRSFLDQPYDRVMEQVRAAVNGAQPAYTFMTKHRLPDIGLAGSITDPAPQSAIDARRLLADRIMHFFILRAVHRTSDEELSERVEITGWDLFERAEASGRGVILLNSHFGPGHLVPLLVARFGRTLTGISGNDCFPFLDIDLSANFEPVELAYSFRARALATAQAVLRTGGIVHTSGDGYATTAAKRWRFFHRYRAFADGTAFLCQSTGAHCMPVFVRSDESGHIRIEFCEVLTPATLEEAADKTLNEWSKSLIVPYARLLEQRWLSDYGNVSPLAIRRFADRAVENPETGMA